MDVDIYDFNKLYGSTHKRVGIGEYVAYALGKEADTISVISSGNLITELKRELEKTAKRVNLVNLINESYKKSRDTIVMKSGRILRDAKEREDYVINFGRQKGINYGKVVDVTDFLPKAYGDEAEKILQLNQDYIALPIGSGKNFVSIYQKILDLGLETKLIGFLPKGENGLFPRDHFEKDGHLYFKRFSPKSKTDKLVAPYMSEDFRNQILQAQKEGHIVHEISFSEEKAAIREVGKFEIQTEPSSAVAFYALNKTFLKDYGIPSDVKMTVLNTGKGIKENNVVNIPISPAKKILGFVVASLVVGSLGYFLNQPSEEKMSAYLEGEFYNRYHPNLLVDGKIPLMGSSALDKLLDERNAFVYGQKDGFVYLSKSAAERFISEGIKSRGKF